MSVREFAKSKGVEVVGKLVRKTVEYTDFSDFGYKYITRDSFYLDEAGNEFHMKNGKPSYIVLADGGVI